MKNSKEIIQQRQDRILQMLRQKQLASVTELAKHFHVTPATIRRDLHAMETDGLIRMQYGNIILLTEKPRELPFAFRENQAKESKRSIARLAASMIPANATVMLDSSSSAMYMADFICPDCGITVFTNCFKTAVKLCENGITVYFMGGILDKRNLVTSGAWTEDALKNINVDYLFFSSKAVDSKGIISGQSETGVKMRRLMLEHARNTYFLCNGEKVGNASTFTLCKTSEITGVITDADLSFIPDTKIIMLEP